MPDNYVPHWALRKGYRQKANVRAYILSLLHS